jgi:hypothetical protein
MVSRRSIEVADGQRCSASDHWLLIQESAVDEKIDSTADQSDMTWNYPSQLGQGFVREIILRTGLVLAIALLSSIALQILMVYHKLL